MPEPLTLENIDDLKIEGALSRLKYVGKAITLTRHELEGKVPLFGFSGAPVSYLRKCIIKFKSLFYSVDFDGVYD